MEENDVVIAYRNNSENKKYYYDDDSEDDDASNVPDFTDEDETRMHELNKFMHSWDNYVLCSSDRNLGIEVKLDGYIN